MAKTKEKPKTIQEASDEELAEELIVCHTNITQAQAVLLRNQEKMRQINLELQQRKEKKDGKSKLS
jgi:hypothetical protein